MPHELLYQPTYANSWALIIGVNAYQQVSPLGYACQDAQAVANVLTSRFGFPADNVTVLLDDEASRSKIMSSFLRFACGDTCNDDRVFIFFAGHGCTRVGRRGEVGYLVPVDGDPNDLGSLIRWDDLTRNADLLPAKHVLFIMDACYGGLAVSRAMAPGATRFLKDMLRRYSRQVLTAGKADEVVADSGGPRAGHSIFTGHLLDALEGGVATADGIVTASAVMAYVYDRVAKDPNSGQTPHYGFLDGDGDFIFAAPILGNLASDNGIEHDVLISVPASATPVAAYAEPSFLESVKDYLSDTRYRIRLDDLASSTIRAVLEKTDEQHFPLKDAVASPEDIASRLRQYEEAVEQAAQLVIMLARWGVDDHQHILGKILARLAERNDLQGGREPWLGLRWYPLTLLLYSGGIAALAANNFRALSTLLTTQIGMRNTGAETQAVIIPAVEGMLDVKRTETFKTLPGYERFYIPESEYLFKALQPRLEDLLFLGNTYESLFDDFEIFQALVFADLTNDGPGHLWGPPGRFGWKHRHRLSESPFEGLVSKAEREKENWPPLKCGLFGGSIERFREIAGRYREELLNRLPWH